MVESLKELILWNYTIIPKDEVVSNTHLVSLEPWHEIYNITKKR